MEVRRPGTPQSHRPLKSGLEVLITDSAIRIWCILNPTIFSQLDEQQFAKNKMIDLKRIEIKISHSFKDVYFVVMECSISGALPLMTMPSNVISDVMKKGRIIDALSKYRTALSLKFHPRPGDEDQGMDSELQVPDTLNSAQFSIGFDDELYDHRTQSEPGALELIRDFAPFEEEENGIQSLCTEEQSTQNGEAVDAVNGINTVNDEPPNQRNQQNDDEPTSMTTNTNPNPTKTTLKSTKSTKSASDKEEMEEDEEKEIVEISHPETAGNALNGTRPKFIGNESDWIHCLYPDLKDIPRSIKLKQIAKIEKPQHIPSRLPRKRKHPPPALQSYQSPPKRPRHESTPSTEDKDVSSGDYSQTSLNSADLREIDRNVEQHQAQKLREKDLKKSGSFEFAKPTFSLTERFRNKQNHHNGSGQRVNESILSVQESVVSDSGHVNDSILSQKLQLDVVMNGDGMELDLSDDNEVNKNDAAQQRRNKNDPPIDPQYLGLITESDLERIHRYMIQVASKLNDESTSS